MAVIRSALLAATAWLALLPALPARAEVALPPVARVTDLTGTLNAEQQAALSKMLADFEARKGSQIAVLLVPTTQPEDIAQFGIRLADAWKLGRKGVDDGAILIIALGDKRMRIEVGRGLEGAITDLAASRIIGEYLRPRFRAGDFYGGIMSAVDRMIALTDGEPLPPPPERAAAQRGGGIQGILPVLLLFGLFGGSVLRAVLGRPLGSVATGGVAAFVAWLLVGTIGIAVFAGIAAFVLALIGGLGGGRLGGGLGGGSWGGGGFGGGGGGFSGGGSSGSW